MLDDDNLTKLYNTYDTQVFNILNLKVTIKASKQSILPKLKLLCYRLFTIACRHNLGWLTFY